MDNWMAAQETFIFSPLCPPFEDQIDLNCEASGTTKTFELNQQNILWT